MELLNNIKKLTSVIWVKIFVLFSFYLFYYKLFYFLRQRFIPEFDQETYNNLTTWLQPYTSYQEGRELLLMFLILPLFCFSVSISIYILERVKINKNIKKVFYILIIPDVYLVYKFFIINLESLKKILSFGNILLTVFILIILFILEKQNAVKYFDSKKINRYFVSTIVFIFFLIIGFLVNYQNPSVFDYGYYIGPALNIIDGKPFSSFYLQYDLGTTLLFALLIYLGATILQIKIILIILMAAWGLLFYHVMKLFTNNKLIIITSLVTLTSFRYILIDGGSANIPQVSVLRMDLWLPIIYATKKWGIDSLKTFIVLGLAYLINDTFGFLYLASFLILFSLKCINQYFYFNEREWLKKWVGLIFYTSLLCIAHKFIYGTWFSLAGSIYQTFHIGFLPIVKNSEFWLLFITIVLLSKNRMIILIKDFYQKEKATNYTELFIMFLVFCQLVYFYGRSHDHNLLNISGILCFYWILTTGTYLMEKNYVMNLTLSFCLALIIFKISYFDSNLIFNKNNYSLTSYRYQEKTDSTYSKKPWSDYMVNNQLIVIEKDIKCLKEYLLFNQIKPNDVFLISDLDAYVQWQTGIKPTTYYTPFQSNISKTEVLEVLKKQSQDRKKLILLSNVYINFPQDLGKLLTDLKCKHVFITLSTNCADNLTELKIL